MNPFYLQLNLLRTYNISKDTNTALQSIFQGNADFRHITLYIIYYNYKYANENVTTSYFGRFAEKNCDPEKHTGLVNSFASTS